MAIATHIKELMNSKGSSVIRKMFEEGIQLKAKFGADKVYDFSLGNPDMPPPQKIYGVVNERPKTICLRLETLVKNPLTKLFSNLTVTVLN